MRIIFQVSEYGWYELLMVSCHKPKGPKPKWPQTGMPQMETATNRNGHKPKRPQTGTATYRNGHIPDRPKTVMASNRNRTNNLYIVYIETM